MKTNIFKYFLLYGIGVVLILWGDTLLLYKTNNYVSSLVVIIIVGFVAVEKFRKCLKKQG